MEQTCITCGGDIHPMRLSILPNTKTCHVCSKVEKVAGHTLITGKNTYSELQIVSQETAEVLAKKGQRVGLVSRGVLFRKTQ